MLKKKETPKLSVSAEFKNQVSAKLTAYSADIFDIKSRLNTIYTVITDLALDNRRNLWYNIWLTFLNLILSGTTIVLLVLHMQVG